MKLEIGDSVWRAGVSEFEHSEEMLVDKFNLEVIQKYWNHGYFKTKEEADIYQCNLRKKSTIH